MFRDLPWKREKLSDVWYWPHLYWLNIFGLWAEDAPTPARRRTERLLRTVTIGYTTLTSICMVIAVVKKFATDGIAQNLVAAFPVAPACIAAYKFIQIARHKKSLKTAMDLLNELTEELKDAEDVAIMKKKMKRFWIVYIVNMLDTAFANIHWCLRPLLIAIVYGERTLIMETWPGPTATWTQFSISYVCQVAAAFPLGFGFSMFDNIFFCICEYILAHMSLLRKSMKNIHLNGKPENTIHLRKIVKRHITILRICKELKYATGSVLTVQVIMTVLSYCSGVFAITVNDEINVNIVMNLSEILIIVTIFLYFYCWYSNEISTSCANLRTSAYKSDWLNGSDMQKKELLVLMAKTMQPVTFGGLIEMNLNTFLTVFKTTFSYYNFLLAVLGTES